VQEGMNEKRRFHYRQAAAEVASAQELMASALWNLSEVQGTGTDVERVDKLRDELRELEIYLNDTAKEASD
jgi:cysteinyl-tRNA synthetase